MTDLESVIKWILILGLFEENTTLPPISSMFLFEIRISSILLLKVPKGIVIIQKNRRRDSYFTRENKLFMQCLYLEFSLIALFVSKLTKIVSYHFITKNFQ